MRALVLSAGGVKGSYQVGALLYLMSQGIEFDIICGSSIGAVNASFLSQYPKEDFNLACRDLEDFWRSIKQKDIYKRWFPFGQLHAFWQKSLYNSKPLGKLIDNQLDAEKMRSSKIQLRIGTVSMKTGVYKLYDQNSPHIKKAVVASASFPPFLTPIQVVPGEDLEYDAGLREYTPIKSAIDAGATEIYILCTEADQLTELGGVTDLKTLGVLKRFIYTLAAEVIENDLKIIESYNKKIMTGEVTDKRIIKCHLIKPAKELVEDSMIVNQEVITKLINIGYNDAKGQLK